MEKNTISIREKLLPKGSGILVFEYTPGSSECFFVNGAAVDEKDYSELGKCNRLVLWQKVTIKGITSIYFAEY